MSWSIRRILATLLKTLLGLVVFIVLTVGGLITYMELTKRPPGSPPPWLEGRKKDDRSGITSFTSFDNIPVDLWLGKRRDGRVDTTHLRIISDYFGKIPMWRGDWAELSVVWPSLRSNDEEAEIRRKNGLPPYEGVKSFHVSLLEITEPDNRDDVSASTVPCEPIIRDEIRRVKYCNEKTVRGQPGERRPNYWPLDETIRTPWHHKPPKFHCAYFDQAHGIPFDRCTAIFSYNTDVRVHIDTNETLATEILANFPKLIAFLQTLEVKP